MENGDNGSTRNRPPRSGFAAVSIALMVALGAACAPDAGDTEKASAALTTTTFTFGPEGMGGSVTRSGRYEEEYRCYDACIDWQDNQGAPVSCVGWEERCGWITSYAALSLNSADSASGIPFPAFNNLGPQSYVGCGPQAIFNVLNYYGITSYSLYDVANSTTTWQWPLDIDENIATTPNGLADSLRDKLNAGHGGAFRVDVQEIPAGDGTVVGFAQAVKGALAHGDPVVALVQGGSHFQVITGFRNLGRGIPNEFYVIDYPYGGHWVGEWDLRRELEGAMSVWGDISPFPGGYDDNVVITVYRTEPLPPPEFHCSASQKCCEPNSNGSCNICVPRSRECP